MKKLLVALAVLVGCGKSPTSSIPTPEEWYALRPTDTVRVVITGGTQWFGTFGGAKQNLEVQHKRTRRVLPLSLYVIMEWTVDGRVVQVDTVRPDGYTLRSQNPLGVGKFIHEFRFPPMQWVRRTVCPERPPTLQPVQCRVDTFHA